MAGAEHEDVLNCDDHDDGVRLFHSLAEDDVAHQLVWMRLEEWDGVRWARRLET
jgi:hypothetical protein